MRGKIGRRLARILARKPLRLTPGASALAVTFDDVPASACDRGAALVEAHDGRASYYVSGHFDEDDTSGRFHTGEDLVRLQAAGHEIGCHGFGHLNYQTLSNAARAEDIARNRAYFSTLGLPEAASFAYPYGCVDPATKRLCGARYPLCRGITAGLNTGVVDAHLLRAIPLYDASWSVARSRAVLEQARREGGLVIFFTHGVEAAPGPFDCSPDLLEGTLQAAAALEIAILPLHAAVARLTAPG